MGYSTHKLIPLSHPIGGADRVHLELKDRNGPIIRFWPPKEMWVVFDLSIEAAEQMRDELDHLIDVAKS